MNFRDLMPLIPALFIGSASASAADGAPSPFSGQFFWIYLGVMVFLLVRRRKKIKQNTLKPAAPATAVAMSPELLRKARKTLIVTWSILVAPWAVLFLASLFYFYAGKAPTEAVEPLDLARGAGLIFAIEIIVVSACAVVLPKWIVSIQNKRLSTEILQLPQFQARQRQSAFILRLALLSAVGFLSCAAFFLNRHPDRLQSLQLSDILTEMPALVSESPTRYLALAVAMCLVFLVNFPTERRPETSPRAT